MAAPPEFKLTITRQAESGIEGTADYIAQNSPQAALRWVRELRAKIDTLRSNPERFGFARENAGHDIELRQVLFGKGRGMHRIIFSIQGDEVVVLDVRHGMRQEHPPGTFGEGGATSS